MSEPKLRQFLTGDLDSLQVDEKTGSLYWRGNRIVAVTPEKEALLTDARAILDKMELRNVAGDRPLVVEKHEPK